MSLQLSESDFRCTAEELGRGGFGIVYRGSVLRDGKWAKAAIKLVPARGSVVDELRLHANVHSKHVVRLLGFCPQPQFDRVIIVMELLGGRSFEALRADRGAAPPGEQQRVVHLIHLAEGLRDCHKEGIVHGDIKPDNAMLSEAGTAKWVDLGLAKEMGGGAQAADRGFFGTLPYAAPELLGGTSHTGRSREADTWAFGQVQP